MPTIRIRPQVGEYEPGSERGRGLKVPVGRTDGPAGHEKAPSLSTGGLSLARYAPGELAAEEVDDAARSLVRLGEDRLASLLQDARLGEVDHLGRHVDVTDAALGSGQVLLSDAEVGDRVLEAVLVGAEVGASRVDRIDGVVDVGDQGLGVRDVLRGVEGAQGGRKTVQLAIATDRTGQVDLVEG